MHNLRHFYYQNKEKIWKVVLIIAFLLGIIYFINHTLKQKENDNNAKIPNNNIQYSNEQNKIYISEQSAISNSTVTEKEVNQINNTISKFLQHCKKGQVEEAYNMLSKNCKENEYATLEKFKQRYLSSKFTSYDVFEITKWINNTYKVTISKDILATGDLNSDKKIDYITIVTEDSEKKLNINGFIGQTTINKQAQESQVKITVLSKKIYMDYELYDFKLENLSNKTIKLDSLKKSGTMYLQSKGISKYNAMAHEIIDQLIEIKSKHESNISIKYAKNYSDDASIEEIVFDNIILDYPKYKNTENIKEFKEICKIAIDI